MLINETIIDDGKQVKFLIVLDVLSNLNHMKQILFILLISLLFSCREKMMIIDTVKNGVTIHTLETYDKETYQILKTCKGVNVKVIHIKK